MIGPIKPVSAARRMCERSGWSLSNLKLQKLLYLAHMIYMGNNNARLIDGTFEAWDYGPVLPEVYNEARPYGSGSIKSGFWQAIPTMDAGRANYLDNAYDQLGRLSSAKLVDMTHQPYGAWYKAYEPGYYHIRIRDKDILDEYNARLRAKTGAT
jgi:uncharacterized phage-associated protein